MDPERTSHKKIIFAIGVLPALLFLASLILLWQIYLPHQRSTGMKHITIAPGMGSRMIGAFLKSQGLIGSKWAFVTYVSLRGEASSLKPGTYEFPDDATIPAISRDLVAGASRERGITIPEGWSIADIASYFEKEGIASREDTARFLTNPPPDILKIIDTLRGTEHKSLEGYLFPDTYRIYADATLADIVGKMLDNFNRKFTADMRSDIARQGKTVSDVIIMASLIEKEVSTDKDRAIVSGILWKRMRLGIPLQVDATIIYITDRKNMPVSRDDLRIDSPYNTYRYAGLPPKPIANPGASALQAAIHPQDSPYLYYLSAPDGRTIFSRTLEEHNAAKARYLK